MGEEKIAKKSDWRFYKKRDKGLSHYSNELFERKKRPSPGGLSGKRHIILRYRGREKETELTRPKDSAVTERE